jgi:hypothetical protein
MWRSLSALLIGSGIGHAAAAQRPTDTAVLFENVRVFDGTSGQLSAPSYVLVRNDTIATISLQPIPTDRSGRTQIVRGGGRTLMPGLIDAHTHLMFTNATSADAATSDLSYLTVLATRAGCITRSVVFRGCRGRGSLGNWNARGATATIVYFVPSNRTDVTDASIAAKLPSPQSVAQAGDLGLSSSLIIGDSPATELHAEAEHREPVAADDAEHRGRWHRC